MSATHTHTHAHRHNDQSRADVAGIQEDYRRDLARRLRRLRGVIRQTVGYEHDALNLAIRQNAADDIAPRERFPFTTTAAKQAAFKQQLQTWLDQGVLEPAGENAVRRGAHYTGRFVRRAYGEGIRFADDRLSTEGVAVESQFDPDAAFNRPIHTDQLEQLYTRNFQNLEAITDDVDRSLSRILTEGLSQGWNPRKTADRLTGEVTDIQHTRARALARTETLHSHNAGAAKRYQERGVKEVEISPSDPCEICQTLVAQNPWPVSEAATLVPDRSHPNCECTILPVV